MKSSPFAYVRAQSVTEAIDLLERHGDDGRLLAGGQSLLPMLAYRMSSPSTLIDIGRINELRFIEQDDGVIRIGALTRHADLETNNLIANQLPLIARAVQNIAHSAIRNRGTIGGSLALADPAAQLPACMIALDATIVTCGRLGERRIEADAFFRGTYETALSNKELLTCVEVPLAAAGTRVHFAQLSRRHGDFAIVGLAGIRSPGPKLVDPLRLVYFGCGHRAARATQTEALLRAQNSSSRAAILDSLSHDLHPTTDLNATAEMRLHLAAVLAERALGELFS
jgi:carbon-monoxide dehydrogenase medium subunit